MPKRRKSMDKEEEEEEEEEEESPKRSLYEVLGVEKTASQEEIRRAYHKLALRLHPDKNPGDESAKEKFQSLQNVIAILGDPAKRKVYDETGSVDDAEFSSEAVQNLYEYFRSIYRKVTEKDIEDFAASYRGSNEEQRDLKDLYVKYKGNMDCVFNYLICSVPKQDSHRFKDIIEEALSSGELKEYKVYSKWAARVAKQRRPSDPLAVPAKKKKNDSEANLMAMISQRSQERMSSLTSTLEAKYGKKAFKKSEEPSEEEFDAARQRMLQKSKKKTK